MDYNKIYMALYKRKLYVSLAQQSNETTAVIHKNTGEEVLCSEINSQDRIHIINLKPFPSGVYRLCISNASGLKCSENFYLSED